MKTKIKEADPIKQAHLTALSAYFKKMNNNAACGSSRHIEIDGGGVYECKGKVFHCPHGQECAIYSCCSTKHGYLNCLKCDKIPCDIWRRTRDPKFSDEEFEKNISDRIMTLHKNGYKKTVKEIENQ